MRRSEVEALMDRKLGTNRKIAADLVLHTCKVFDVGEKDLLSNYKYRFLALPRFAIYRALCRLGWSHRTTAEVLGKERTSVTNGIKRVEDFAKRDPVYAAKVEDVEQMAKSLYNYHEGKKWND